MSCLKNTFAFIVFCLVMLSGFGLKAQQFKGEASVAKDTFIVGDSIGVLINIVGEPGHIYRLQEIPHLQGLEWMDSFYLQQDFTTNTFVFPVTGFDSGSFTFPQLVFNVFNTDNDVVAAAQTQAFPINITYAQVDTSKDIKPIKAPIEVDYSPMPIWPFVLLALIVLALVFYLYRRWKKKQPEPSQQPVIQAETQQDPLTYAEEAIRQIEQLLKDNTLQNEQQYWFGLKEILRTYIQKHYKLRTQEKTSAQILAELRKKPVRAENIADLDNIFARTDQVLFAKYLPEDGEKNIAAQDAVSFIKSTMHGEEI